MFSGRLLILMILLWANPLRSDGLEVKDGRYAGGKSIILKLTPKQAELIRSKYQPGMDLSLTKAQQAQLRQAAHLKIAPTKVFVGHATDWANDCTCFASNIAIDFKPGFIELPVKYLMSDKEAEKNHGE